MFEDHFSPTVGHDHYYPIHTYTPAQGNREHTHDDVADGIAEVSYNYEVIGTNTDGSRHSSRLFLVDDQYYVRSSRSGLEACGNTLWFSKNSPEELRFAVLDTVFNRILQRQTEDIKIGDEPAGDAEHLAILTPESFVLQTQLSQEELTEYYDTVADYTFELIGDYHDATSIEDFKQIVESYDEKTTELFRDATGFEPSIIYNLFQATDYNGTHLGWRVPTEVQEDTNLELCMYEDPIEDGDTTYMFFIEITSGLSPQEITLYAEKDFDTDIELFSYQFETLDEAEWALELCLNIDPTQVILDDL